ncbi:hypothetical protein [Limnobacter sp.]|uniref:hypothetical protein n=1 Tax=Limnobacter sp. TaxID=2003368 RepID=UPI002FDF7CFC
MSKLFCLVLGLLCCVTAQAKQEDPTPRREMSPRDAATVTNIQAKRWTTFGQAQQIARTESGNKPGQKSCVTQVGQPSQPVNDAPKYGPRQTPQMVVVTGSVINVCN